MQQPRLGSLFAGIGGFDLGFERAGFKTVWQCEIDKAAQGVLRRRFPDAKLHFDVREVGAHNLEPVDAVTFGSPCQDLSVAGKRAGLAGGRSGLFYEATRIIRELRERYGKPDFAIWENVPGAFSSNEGRDFAAVVQAMVDIGARDVCWRVLDSQNFGVAQRRRRVFLVADFGGERAEQVLFEPESLRGNPAKGRKAGEEVAGSAGGGAAGGGGDWPARVASTLNTAFGEKMGLEDQHALNGAPLFVPVAPIAFHPTQDPISSVAICVTGEPYTLAIRGRADGATLEARQDGLANAVLTPTGGRSGVGVGAVCVTGEITHALRAEGADASEEGTGRGTPVVAVPMVNMQGSKGNAVAQEDGPSYTLNSMHGHDVHAVVLPFSVCPDHCGGDKSGQDVAFVKEITVSRTLDCTGADVSRKQGGVGIATVAGTLGGGSNARGWSDDLDRSGAFIPTSTTSIRRLTPTECERLQGFPDGWTTESIDATGKIKPQADGPRYKQMGNAVTVSVAEWIAHRIARELRG